MEITKCSDYLLYGLHDTNTLCRNNMFISEIVYLAGSIPSIASSLLVSLHLQTWTQVSLSQAVILEHVAAGFGLDTAGLSIGPDTAIWYKCQSESNENTED